MPERESHAQSSFASRAANALARLTRVFVRYLGVQALGYLIDMGLFLLLSHAINPIVANIASKTVAGLFGFFANRYFTFKAHRHGRARSQLIKYAILVAANIPISSALFTLFMRWIAPLALAKFVADVICMGLNFLLSHYVVFNRTQATKSIRGD